MSAPKGPPLTDFIAYELPTEKWMKLVGPKVRLRVRGKRSHFVSSAVKVNNQRSDAETDSSCTYWPWDVDEPFLRPSFSNDEAFEIVIERRFLLRYKCIQRTNLVTMNQVRASNPDPYVLPLYDGECSAEELRGEHRVEIGKITFTLKESVETGENSREGEQAQATRQS